MDFSPWNYVKFRFLRAVLSLTVGLFFGVTLADLVVAAPSKTLVIPTQDDLNEPFEQLRPVTPQSESDQRSARSLSWYLTGRVLEFQKRFPQSLEAYKRAFAEDPKSTDALRAAVQISARLGNEADATELAEKAVALSPDDFELLIRLGQYYANSNDIERGLSFLERASKSPKLDKKSAPYIFVMRDLGILYRLKEKSKEAAECYLVVFDAIRNRMESILDARRRFELLADPRTSYERIGMVLLDGGKVDVAEQAFELAIQSGKTGAGNASYYRARVLHANQKYDEALNELQKYFDSQRQSKGREAYQLLGQILTSAGRANEFLGKLEVIAKNDLRNPALQRFYAEQLMAANRLEESRDIYQVSLQGNSDINGLLGLAQVLRKLRQHHELLEILGKTIAKNTGAEDVASAITTEFEAISNDEACLNGLVAEGDRLLGQSPPALGFQKSYVIIRLLMLEDRVDDADRFYRAAIRERTESSGKLYDEWTSALFEAKKFGNCAAICDEGFNDKFISLNEKRLLAFRMIQAFELDGQTERALQAAKEAQKAVPNDPRFVWQEGWVYYHARKFTEAIEVMDPLAVKLSNSNDDLSVAIRRQCQMTLSNIYVMQGDIQKGEEILEAVFREDPEDESVNNDLGYLYADQGKKLDQAEEMIRKALKGRPDNAAYLDSLGWVLFKQGKYLEALEPLEKATKTPTGGDATIWEHLGDVQEKLERGDAAKESWQKSWDEARKETHPDTKLLDRLKSKLKIQE